VTADPFALAADAFAPREHTLADEDFPTPGALASSLDSTMVNPPHLAKIDEAVVHAADGTGPRRLLVVMAPQEGKSERGAHYTPLWLLKNNPDLRIAITSYEDEAATRWGRFIRDDINRFDLGIRVREDVKAAGRWYVDGHRGSVFCAGIAGPLTGRPVDVLIIDDPVKGPAEADSATAREGLWNWWLAVARTRLAPGAIVIVIMTRWHPDDLAGRLLEQEGSIESGGKWLVLRIPTVAEENDPIGRKPGEWLPSARGRTVEEWEDIRAGLPDRWWTAMYQGRPAPPEGAVWQQSWIDDTRRKSVASRGWCGPSSSSTRPGRAKAPPRKPASSSKASASTGTCTCSTTRACAPRRRSGPGWCARPRRLERRRDPRRGGLRRRQHRAGDPVRVGGVRPLRAAGPRVGEGPDDPVDPREGQGREAAAC
jgi:hypothetical protein